MTFALDFEFLDAPGVKDAAEAATWAALRVDVAGVTVSQLLDERHGKVRSQFYGSALPLAEWVLEAWPRLVHERRVPLVGTDAWWDWRGFHHLRTGRRGGAMPDLRLMRFSDDAFEVRARADQGDLAPGMSVRFVRSVRARVATEQVLAGLDRFLQAVEAQLAEVKTPRASAYRARLTARDVGNGELEVLGRLGLARAELPALQALLGNPRRDELLAIMEASGATSLQARLEEATAVVAQLPAPPAPEARWARLEETARKTTASAPWLTGWAAAEQLRQQVGLGPAEPLAPKLQVLGEAWGWDALAWVRPVPRLATGVDTVHARVPGAPPCVVTTVRAPEARVFRAARALYHGLFGGRWKVQADSRLLGSRLSEANAFAAELVAPVARLRDFLPADGVWEEADVKTAALAVGANASVVRHQVENREGLGMLGEAGEG